MHQLRINNLIVIDIETASAAPSFEMLDRDWQVLWQEKTSKIKPEDVSTPEFYTMRSAVMAEFSKVICISIGYFIKEQNLKLRVKSFYGDDEKKILSNFLETLQKIENLNNKWCFAGHNIKEFDIPFICRRLVANGIRIPSFIDFQNMKPWDTNIVDTFQYWRFGDYKNYTSLKLLAAVMNVPSSKDDIDGSMVGPLYHNGNEEERKINMKRIAVYCQKDVATTANIILRFRNETLLHPDDIEIVKV